MFTNPKHLGRWLAIAVALGLVCAAPALAVKPVKPPPAYTIVPFLATPPEGFQSVCSHVRDLNDAGNAVGSEEFERQLDDGSYETVYWGLHRDFTTGACTPLHDCQGAVGINNSNQIVGDLSTTFAAAFWRAFDDLNPVDLPLLPGYIRSDAEAINDGGFVVGRLWRIDGDVFSTDGVVWRVVCDEDGNVSVAGPVALPPLAGDTCTWTVALSELSELSSGSLQFYVTGHSASVLDLPHEAVVWTVAVDPVDGTFTPGPAVSLVENQADSCGNDVNIDGDVCGVVRADGSMPFLAPAGQTAQLLPVRPDTHWGWASDINNPGEIVGHLYVFPYKIKGKWTGGDYAYLWKDGNPIDLTTQIDPATGWSRLRAANVINDAGMIGGSGYRGELDVQWRGFVLIPNPQ